MSQIMRLTAPVFLVCTAAAGGLGIVVARQEPASKETVCVRNLRQIGIASLMYAQDYDGRLPPMESMTGTRKAIYPYVKNNQVFLCPTNAMPYKTNPAVSLKPIAVIAEPSKTVGFYDPAPHADGKYSVAYLDGLNGHRMASPTVRREAKVPVLAPKFITKKTPLPTK